jgi:YidC/Oxa1 family membrane protein insertase
MSQAQPSPKQSLVQTIILFLLIFMGFQLFFNRGGGEEALDTELLTATEIEERIRDRMYEEVAKPGDVNYPAVTRLIDQYESKLENDQTELNLSDQQIEAEVFSLRVLVWDTMLKEAIAENDREQISQAYNQILPQFERRRSESYWTEPVEVIPTTEMDYARISPEELYTDLQDELQSRNVGATVVGIPGGYQFIDFLVNLTGAQPWFSYWFAALILAIGVRVAVWPLVQKQLMFGRMMQQLQPKIKEIQAKYKDKRTGRVSDPQAFQQETMKLYRDYGINPLAGCFPMLIQVPLFILIYQFMLLYKFEFTKGYFLWVNPGAEDLGILRMAHNLGERDFILILVYMVSMVTTTMLMPVSDPSNARMQRIIGISMAVIFPLFMLFDFFVIPSAFVLYWIFTNVIATTQSLIAYRMPAPELKKVEMSTMGGAKPEKRLEDDKKRKAIETEATSNGEAEEKPETNGKPIIDTTYRPPKKNRRKKGRRKK